jgi:hypothetical protein
MHPPSGDDRRPLLSTLVDVFERRSGGAIEGRRALKRSGGLRIFGGIASAALLPVAFALIADKLKH